MAEMQISRRDIDSLADKLARLEPELTPPERALLLFMLGVAADSINRSDAMSTPARWCPRPTTRACRSWFR